MQKRVTIVDYGIGNVFSVMRAIEHVGGIAVLTDDPQQIIESELLVIPGVGAFPSGMAGLRERGLIEPIRSFAASGRPVLGICLGMQMLVTESEEFGLHEGLDLIRGRVVPVESEDNGRALKIPHIGWSSLQMPSSRASWDGTLLEKLPDNPEAYFVHSYTVVTDRSEDLLAETMYGDCHVGAAIQHENVTGFQFHPEKSGEVGLMILRNFLDTATGRSRMVS
jgi:imidazole glycerol-phosphate synthase subunit HisH